MLGAMKPEQGLQAFDSGDVLFAYEDPTHTKYEIRVDNDDLAGDEDSFSLSIHQFRDGKEQDGELGLMSSHFTVSMKLLQNIWRLNKVSVGAEFPVGDAKFVEKTFFKTATKQPADNTLLPEPHTEVSFVTGTGIAPPAMAPEQVVTMLAYAENSFAATHPEAGFTCSVAELSQFSALMGVDQQITTNGTYNGYRFALGGCEGKPAGSFQITAEPLVPGRDAKAFCTDATHNLRELDAGTGQACLISGKVRRSENEGVEGVSGLGIVKHEASPNK
jgi:hypothetical protein